MPLERLPFAECMPIISPPQAEVDRAAHYSSYRVGVNKNQSANYFEYECLFSVPTNEEASVYMFTDASVTLVREEQLMPNGLRAFEDSLYIEPAFTSDLRKFTYLPRSSAIPYCIYQNLDGINSTEFNDTVMAIVAINYYGSEAEIGHRNVLEAIEKFYSGQEPIFIRGGTKIGKAKLLSSSGDYQYKLTMLFHRSIDERAILGFFDASQRNKVLHRGALYRPYVGHPLITAVRGVPVGAERISLYQTQNISSLPDGKYDKQELNGELVTMDFDTYPPTLSLQQAMSTLQLMNLPSELAYLASDPGFGKQSFKIFNPDARQLSVIDATPNFASNPSRLGIAWANITASTSDIKVWLWSGAATPDSIIQVKDDATGATLLEIIVRVLPFKAVPVRFHTITNTKSGVTLHESTFSVPTTHLLDIVKVANSILGKQANVFLYPGHGPNMPQYETSVIDGLDMGLHVPIITTAAPDLLSSFNEFGAARDFWTNQLYAIHDFVDSSYEFNAFYIWSMRYLPITVRELWWVIDRTLSKWTNAAEIIRLKEEVSDFSWDPHWEAFTLTLEKQLLKNFVNDPTLTPVVDEFAKHFHWLSDPFIYNAALSGIAPAEYWAPIGWSSMSIGEPRFVLVERQFKASAPAVPLDREEGLILAHEFCHSVAHNLDPSEQVHFSHMDVGVNSVEGNLMFKSVGWQLLTLQKDLLHKGLPNY